MWYRSSALLSKPIFEHWVDHPVECLCCFQILFQSYRRKSKQRKLMSVPTIPSKSSTSIPLVQASPHQVEPRLRQNRRRAAAARLLLSRQARRQRIPPGPHRVHDLDPLEGRLVDSLPLGNHPSRGNLGDGSGAACGEQSRVFLRDALELGTGDGVARPLGGALRDLYLLSGAVREGDPHDVGVVGGPIVRQDRRRGGSGRFRRRAAPPSGQSRFQLGLVVPAIGHHRIVLDRPDEPHGVGQSKGRRRRIR
mmetsp:Transcript_26208/g.61580  ORF Transcript_26208/g.61580 Transcript_26208/m.61580 type:complete len:251 (-) Transcript_26208:506-1258(-)